MFPSPGRLPRSRGFEPGPSLDDFHLKQLLLPGLASNDPFGSRPEPGDQVLAPILLLPPGKVPEGRARGVQDTARQVKSIV